MATSPFSEASYCKVLVPRPTHKRGRQGVAHDREPVESASFRGSDGLEPPKIRDGPEILNRSGTCCRGQIRHGPEGKFSPGGKLVVGNHSSRLTFYTITKQEIRMSTTCLVPPRGLVSVEVAAQQVGAHPQTLLTRSTFPVHYPVLAPERGPRWQTHAQRRNLGISVRPGHPAPAATCPAHVRHFHAIWFPSRLRPSKFAPTLRPC